MEMTTFSPGKNNNNNNNNKYIEKCIFIIKKVH